MGILVWGPLGRGVLTSGVRNGQQTDVVRAFLSAFSDEHRAPEPDIVAFHAFSSSHWRKVLDPLERFKTTR